MQFSGAELKAILRQQHDPVVIYDARSFTRGRVIPEYALKLTSESGYWGIGNRRRIRTMRPMPDQLCRGPREVTRARQDRDALRWRERLDRARSGEMGRRTSLYFN